MGIEQIKKYPSHWTKKEKYDQIIIDRKELCANIAADRSHRDLCRENLDDADESLSKSIRLLAKFDAQTVQSSIASAIEESKKRE